MIFGITGLRLRPTRGTVDPLHGAPPVPGRPSDDGNVERPLADGFRREDQSGSLKHVLLHAEKSMDPRRFRLTFSFPSIQVGDQVTSVANTSAAAQKSASKPKFYKGYRTSGQAPNNFREMQIFPTQADLDEKNPFLRSNIVKGQACEV